MSFEYGQIILVPVADGLGNSKPHPAVILSPTDQIKPGIELRVICVSTQIEVPCPPHHIPLPWQRPRHPKTGLNKPNVAKCNWLARVARTMSSRSWVSPRQAISGGSSRSSRGSEAAESRSGAITPLVSGNGPRPLTGSPFRMDPAVDTGVNSQPRSRVSHGGSRNDTIHSVVGPRSGRMDGQYGLRPIAKAVGLPATIWKDGTLQDRAYGRGCRSR